ncbi:MULTISPECIES: hypothetical protein [Mammaliicoccus]|uniref:hypothetical protein n=1 Tax=Mammaliicoccus TaxID=2803850 RepID=UPI000D1F98E0|nr:MULTISPECIES: hypothetical protein [Mammaliicoccus]MEB5759855.1 hypothetical protein [Mammaliicoccus sciuri]MEB6340486.1 hypothetical protein [Mammaliicoccus sciuri]PTK06491.1 hypothetical protein BUZ89_09095 [Mammaliicoccus sciuri]QQC96399.1 hypothetical protein JCQ35_05065 [Mammaliicoccus sciuri]
MVEALVTKVGRSVTKASHIKSLRVEIKNGDSYYRQQTDEELKKDFTSFSDENTKLYIKEMKRADTIRFITYVLLIIGFFGIILSLY